jgi:choline dehydrogenase-like flavoprotein
MSTSTHYDIIIGTTPGGGTLAYKLTPSGQENPATGE